MGLSPPVMVELSMHAGSLRQASGELGGWNRMPMRLHALVAAASRAVHFCTDPVRDKYGDHVLADQLALCL